MNCMSIHKSMVLFLLQYFKRIPYHQHRRLDVECVSDGLIFSHVQCLDVYMCSKTKSHENLAWFCLLFLFHGVTQRNLHHGFEQSWISALFLFWVWFQTNSTSWEASREVLDILKLQIKDTQSAILAVIETCINLGHDRLHVSIYMLMLVGKEEMGYILQLLSKGIYYCSGELCRCCWSLSIISS